MKHYSPEEKLEIVLASLRNEASKADLCRQRGIAPMSLDGWIKRFLEAGKAGLKDHSGVKKENGELERLRKENERLQHELSERDIDIRILKKVTGQMPLTGAGSK